MRKISRRGLLRISAQLLGLTTFFGGQLIAHPTRGVCNFPSTVLLTFVTIFNKLAQPTYYFLMLTHFLAEQSVEIVVPEQPVPINHYLRQPQRLVNALVEPSQMEQLSPEKFRLKMRPRDFMMFRLQPTVDLRVWAKPDGTVHLTSVGCEIRGVDYINRRFALDLVGKLTPCVANGTTYLKGKADLTVQVDVPPPLDITPQSILQTAGNGLLRSILLTIKLRLMQQLLLDYRHWAANEIEAVKPSVEPIFSPNRQTA